MWLLVVLALTPIAVFIASAAPKWLWVAAFFAVGSMQIYVGNVNLHRVLSMVVLLFCAAVLRKRLLRYPLFKAAVALIGLQLLSLVWSPNLEEGLIWISGEVPFLSAFALIALLATRLSREDLLRALSVGVVFASFNLMLMIYFRVSPVAELEFLRSQLPNFFMGPKAIENFWQSGNNVVDPLKSGGVYLNANTASAYAGVLAMLSTGLYLQRRKKYLLVFAVLAFAAVVASGCRTGMLLAVVLPCFGVAIWQRQKNLFFLGALVSAAGLMFVGIDDISARGSETAAIRAVIWQHIPSVILSNPFLGQGFGGWDPTFANYAADRGLVHVYPPHNVVFYTFSQSGLLATIALLFCVVTLLRFTIRATTKFALCSGLAGIWVVLHGFGDNTSVFGDPRMATFLGCALGVASQVFRPSVPQQSQCQPPLATKHLQAPQSPLQLDSNLTNH